MKKLSIILLVFLSVRVSAQTTVVLQPHFTNGIEGTPYGIDTTSPDWPGNPHQYCSDSTYYTYPDFCLNGSRSYAALTWVRHVIRFSQLSDSTVIPHNAIIDSAVLHLYGIPYSTYGNFGNSYFPGSIYESAGPNSGWVYQLSDSFNPHTITWNTMPGFMHTDSVAIDPSTTQWGEDDSLVVTGMVANMVAHHNTGFIAMLQDENTFSIERIFGSCFNPDSTKHPSLMIKYHMPTTGVHALPVKGVVSAFPNPVSSVLNIQWTGLSGANASVTLTDVTGRVVLKTELSSSNNTHGTMQVNLSNLNDGIYLLTINSESLHYTSKIVVSKK